jgi:hypothetical protein
MSTTEPDPADPGAWFRLMVVAIAGLQGHCTGDATTYLRFVEKHRGRAQADAAKIRLKQYAASDAFRESWRIVNKLNGVTDAAFLPLARNRRSPPARPPANHAFARGVVVP